MQKFLNVLVILTLLVAGAVFAFAERYEVVPVSGGVIVFDRLTSTFVEKNDKGEWVKVGIKQGEIFMDVVPPAKSDMGGERPSGPARTPTKKPDVKI